MNNEKDLELGNYQINESDPTEQPTVKGVDVNGDEYPRLPLDADTGQPKMTIAESIDDFDWPVTGKMKHTSKQLTPMQELIEWIDTDNQLDDHAKASIKQVATYHKLTSEKEFVKEIAAIAYAAGVDKKLTFKQTMDLVTQKYQS